MVIYLTQIHLCIYIYIHLFTHINLGNQLSCIYLFVSGVFIYVYVFYVVKTVLFIYYLLILSCLFIYVCVIYVTMSVLFTYL